MITERHNVACRFIMKAIKAGSLGGCFVQINIGSEDRLASQNLQIPVGSHQQSCPQMAFPPLVPYCREHW